MNQKSKDTTVIMTAHGTAHTTEESNSVCLSFELVCQRITRGTIAGQLCEEHGCSYEWLRVSHHISSTMGENRQPHSLGGPDVQATDHKTKALDDRKPAQDVGDFERRVETKLPEWHQPFMEGFKGGLQVRQTCLQLTWPYHRQHFLFPRILLQNLLSTKQEGKHNLLTHFL